MNTFRKKDWFSTQKSERDCILYSSTTQFKKKEAMLNVGGFHRSLIAQYLGPPPHRSFFELHELNITHRMQSLLDFRNANIALFDTIFLPAYFDTPYQLLGLRASCTAMRAVIPPPQHFKNAKKLLVYCAEHGDIWTCKFVMENVKFKGARETILFAAARNGHEHICRLAREWMLSIRGRAENETDWNQMLMCAAYSGHEHICRLAREWLLSARLQTKSGTDWNEMLGNAARGGHEHICRLAREWGARNWNWMLDSAAMGGHEHICKLAREWGATDWNMMLYYASIDGQEHIRRLAREWGATDWERSFEWL
jgi:hypothetical protein